MIVLPGTTVGANRDTIFRMAEQHRLPTIYAADRRLVAAGGLMSYGAGALDQVRRRGLLDRYNQARNDGIAPLIAEGRARIDHGRPWHCVVQRSRRQNGDRWQVR